jgi:hypothetical protein
MPTKFAERNELKRFTRSFVKTRIDSLKKDVSYCLQGAAAFPALLYCMSTIYLLGELFVVKSGNGTTENSIKYMQEVMGYTPAQSDLVMKLFRHKLVHLAQPRPITVYPKDSENIVAWQYVHSDEQKHLLLENLPSKIKVTIKSGWEIEVNQVFTIGIWQLVEDIEASLYRHGGYLDQFENSEALQNKFADFIEGIYKI